MTFVSYAQNFEDVMLWRALSDVSDGFYIDVGAQDPVGDSVTKAFYDAGWRGINIEPVRFWFDRLTEARPRDVCLRRAISDHVGSLRIYEIENSGLSTALQEVAEEHRRSGYQVSEQVVECTTLDAILEEHEVGEVHFLKLDCEGSEAAALRGISLDRNRPWIIVVESMSPNSQIPDFAEWETLITGCRYHFVYEDGLNRYYVADEKADLDNAFEYPPNIFDGFMRASEHHVRNELDDQRAEWAKLHRVADAQRIDLERLSGEIEAREKRIEALSGQVSELSLQQQQAQESLLAAERELERNRESVARLSEALDTANAAERSSRKSIAQLSEALGGKDLEINDLHAQLGVLDRQIQAVYASTSWRISWPVRAMRRALGRSKRAGRSGMRTLMVGIARTGRPLARYLFRNDRLASLLESRLGSDSSLGMRFQQFIGLDLGFRSSAGVENEQFELSWQARRAYAEMADMGLVAGIHRETESFANRS